MNLRQLQQFVALAETGSVDTLFAGLEAWVQQDVGAVIHSCSTLELAA